MFFEFWQFQWDVLQLKKVVLLVMTIQTVSAMAISLTLMCILQRWQIFQNIYVGDVNVSGMNRAEAVEALTSRYKETLDEGYFVLDCGEEKQYGIKYKDIGTSIDLDSSLDQVYGISGLKAIVDSITDIFKPSARSVPVLLSFNEAKLKKKLYEIAALLNREPANARIALKNDTIETIAEVTGRKLDMDRAVEIIKEEGLLDEGHVVSLSGVDDPAVITVAPGCTLEDLSQVDGIIAECRGTIARADLIEDAKEAASAIDNVFLREGESEGGGDEFSFAQCLAAWDQGRKEGSEGYNLVASCLYKAVLKALIDSSAIKRTPPRSMTDYMEPGFDVAISQGEGDLSFRNTLKTPLVIVAEVKNSNIRVALAGKTQGKASDATLKSEVVQRFSPGQITIVNQELNQGEKRVINPGREGAEIHTFRLLPSDNGDIKKEFLTRDKYEAIPMVIEIGSGRDGIPGK